MPELTDKSVREKLHVSQAYFNPVLLYFYDWVVFSFVAKFIWGVSTELLLKRYEQMLRNAHLEVGVGTGYLLDKLNPDEVSLDLMDLSENCLDKTRRRLVRFNPATYLHNILEPCDSLASTLNNKYKSLSLNFVMHCVPGDYLEKSSAFGHLKKLLTDDGLLFGASVVAKGNKANWFTKPVMWILNSIGLFNNRDDHPEDLRSGLEAHFRYVSVRVVAATAFYSASDDEAVFMAANGFDDLKSY